MAINRGLLLLLVVPLSVAATVGVVPAFADTRSDSFTVSAHIRDPGETVQKCTVEAHDLILGNYIKQEVAENWSLVSDGNSKNSTIELSCKEQDIGNIRVILKKDDNAKSDLVLKNGDSKVPYSLTLGSQKFTTSGEINELSPPQKQTMSINVSGKILTQDVEDVESLDSGYYKDTLTVQVSF